MMSDWNDNRLAHSNVRAIVASFFDQHKRTSFPWFVRGPDEVEVAFSYRLPIYQHGGCLCQHTIEQHKRVRSARYGSYRGGCRNCACARYKEQIYHVGKMDIAGWEVDDPDTPCVVDHKTSGTVDGRFVRRYRRDSQLSGYLKQRAMRADVPAHTLNAYINAIELGVLPYSNKKCSKHGVTYAECGPDHAHFQVIGPIERTKEQIEHWEKQAIRFAIKFHRIGLLPPEETDTEGEWTGACSYCELNDWCNTGRSPIQKQSMIYNRWEPHPEHEPHILYLDNSKLSSTVACSTQAAMRYHAHLTTPEYGGPLFAGSAVHAALETWWKGGTVKEALAALDLYYKQGEAA